MTVRQVATLQCKAPTALVVKHANAGVEEPVGLLKGVRILILLLIRRAGIFEVATQVEFQSVRQDEDVISATRRGVFGCAGQLAAAQVLRAADRRDGGLK